MKSELIAQENGGSWGQFVVVDQSRIDEMASCGTDASNIHELSPGNARPSLGCSHRRDSSSHLSMLCDEEMFGEEASTNDNKNNHHYHFETDEKEKAMSHGFVFGARSPSECTVSSYDSCTSSDSEDDEDFGDGDCCDFLSEGEKVQEGEGEEEEEEEEEEDDDDDDDHDEEYINFRFTFESKCESVERDLDQLKKGTTTSIKNDNSLLNTDDDELVVEEHQETEMKESLSFTIQEGITFSFS